MIERLVWNFECSTDNPLPLTELETQQQEDIKWEARFFWPRHDIISLCAIDDSMMELANFKLKQREDEYYILPEANYNIKRRRNELLYKPVMKRSKLALGFGPKIDLDIASINNFKLENILNQTNEQAKKIHVAKEAFIYKCNTTPTIKIELARLKVMNSIYFSLCVEGRSADLVEKISKHLLGEQISCDYVTFLKQILTS